MQDACEIYISKCWTTRAENRWIHKIVYQNIELGRKRFSREVIFTVSSLLIVPNRLFEMDTYLHTFYPYTPKR